MRTIQEVCDFLHEFAPPQLAEDWDNVGLLVGDPSRAASRIMTCLTVTPESAGEAVDQDVDLLVSHHPFPFRPIKQLTTRSTTGRLLLQLIEAGIAVHSPHTAFDSAAMGINQLLATGLGLSAVRPLVESTAVPPLGSGRYGELPEPQTLADFAQVVKTFLKIPGLHLVGQRDQLVRRVAVACGSAGTFLGAARDAGCDVLVTGETSFHTCLDGEATGIGLILPGHYASERFAVERLAVILAERFPDATVWASRAERDPLQWLP